MRSSKSLLALLAVVLFSSGTIAQPDSQKDRKSDLYKGLEFKMPVIKEPVIPANSVSIVEFGAVGGGQALCTDAFAKAIEALSKKGGGRVVVPRGTWFTGPITLKSNIELYTEAGALILFSPDKNLYPLVSTNFEGYNTYRCTSPVNGRNLENVAITGKGVLDGSGDVWRLSKRIS